MRRQTGMFRDTAVESPTLSIVLFNRPSTVARKHAAIKQDRDRATHDTISMSEEILWLHMRGGITIFNRVLPQAFAQSLDELLPNRAIPDP